MCHQTDTEGLQAGARRLGKADRPDIATIFHAHSETYQSTHSLSVTQQRAIQAIEACRTAELGGHVERCDTCERERIRYNSCRNRHCPKCQAMAKERWLQARCDELLPVTYFHLVFTLPHDLNPLAQGNPRQLYNLLFRAVSATLLAFGRNPKRLNGELGITLVLHTWGQNLGQHLHLHCIVTGGALTAEGQWKAASNSYLFPIRALSNVFRAKYLEGLQQLYDEDALQFAGGTAALAQSSAFKQFLAQLKRHDWVVFAKAPFEGAEEVLSYVSRYTHRVAISNDRIMKLEQEKVSFQWKDYADKNRKKTLVLKADEFIRRFLLHILPSGFMRIRHYGLQGNRCKAKRLAQCRKALNQPEPEERPKECVEAFMLRVLEIDIHQCPFCKKGRLHTVQTLLEKRKAWLNTRPKGPPMTA